MTVSPKITAGHPQPEFRILPHKIGVLVVTRSSQRSLYWANLIFITKRIFHTRTN